MERNIVTTLKQLGIPANLKGYKYLQIAITKYLESDVRSTRERAMAIYQSIADAHQCKCAAVERCIRNAIETGISRGDIVTWTRMFGYSYSSFRGKPTNMEFIATVAEHVRLFCTTAQGEQV